MDPVQDSLELHPDPSVESESLATLILPEAATGGTPFLQPPSQLPTNSAEELKNSYKL